MNGVCGMAKGTSVTVKPRGSAEAREAETRCEVSECQGRGKSVHAEDCILEMLIGGGSSVPWTRSPLGQPLAPR